MFPNPLSSLLAKPSVVVSPTLSLSSITTFTFLEDMVFPPTPPILGTSLIFGFLILHLVHSSSSEAPRLLISLKQSMVLIHGHEIDTLAPLGIMARIMCCGSLMESPLTVCLSSFFSFSPFFRHPSHHNLLGALVTDLWSYNIESNQWTSHRQAAGTPSTYPDNIGEEGVIGSRAYINKWVDDTGSLWLYGGSGLGSFPGLTISTSYK